MVPSRLAGNLSIDLILNQLRTACATSLVMVFALFAVAEAQPPRQQLSKIEVIGLKRLTQQHVIATSGLATGQTVDPKTLDVAAQKLIDSGLFKKVAYRLRGTGSQAIVTFTVEEAVRRMPVYFDNFVWFTDEEIYVAIRRDVTFFDGTVPEDGDTAEKVAASLRRLLNEKNISAQVEVMPYANLATGKQELMFSVKAPGLLVCSLHFPGASAIAEEQLIKSANSLLRTEYSRKDVGLFAMNTLLQLYRHLGYLSAEFASPVAVVSAAESGECKDGVAVTISVEEGAQYSWERAEWTGNKVLDAEQLNLSFGMKTGDLADGRQIDKGRSKVAKEYAKKGYMAVKLSESTTLDEPNQRVIYHFNVSEGPQFHMGDLAIVGLSDEDSRRVKELWQLAPGSVFDQSYVDGFVTKAVRDFLDKHPVFSGVPLKIGVETKPDPKRLAVDLTITFK
jgi:outer membrane protein assembly factor BamA